jgi:hypothetical protein
MSERHILEYTDDLRSRASGHIPEQRAAGQHFADDVIVTPDKNGQCLIDGYDIRFTIHRYAAPDKLEAEYLNEIRIDIPEADIDSAGRIQRVWNSL